ncbi:hypothetical protein [Pseudooceanicola sp. LIPI14-2-Ac024]|uniref:hypothetical protein n=1 Tax=Pseudooceanicola sp. LIPI14-2-Ac024 TaxID=3344875 RepID=UPI0035CFB953
MTTTAQTDKAAAALKALDEAWAYYTPLPKAVPTARQDEAQPVYAPYTQAA